MEPVTESAPSSITVEELILNDEDIIMPYIPDLDDSDEEASSEAVRQPESFEIEKRSKEELRKMYANSLSILETLRLHNHSDREIYKMDDLFTKLESQATPNSVPIERIDATELSTEEFTKRFMSGRGQPVIIRGIPENEGWEAHKIWTNLETLLDHYGCVPIKVFDVPPPGGIGKPFEVRLPLALYEEYSRTNQADSPFYGFEYDFTETRSKLLTDYKIPSFFRDDFYQLNARTKSFYPNNKHLLVGGRRTGTNLHFDPKGTCAWNTCLIGRKKWAMFPPCTQVDYCASIGSPTCCSGTAPGGAPANWWIDALPFVPKSAGMIEFVQEAGETVFIPCGWWHCVVNLEFNMCITENFLPMSLLPSAWSQLKKDWPNFSGLMQHECPQVFESVNIPLESLPFDLNSVELISTQRQ